MSYRGRLRNGVVVFDAGIDLPEGSEVEVRALVNGSISDDQESNSPATLLERLRDVVGIAADLPPDFASNHDHYIHGSSKREA